MSASDAESQPTPAFKRARSRVFGGGGGGGGGGAATNRRTADTEDYVGNLRAEREQLTLDKITQYLEGKPEVADLVLFQLETGKFDRKVVLAPEHGVSLPQSTNKVRLISKEHLIMILTLVDGEKFRAETLCHCGKLDLVHLLAMLGRIDPSSAPPSKKLAQIANWVQRRDASLGTRKGIMIDNEGAIDFESCGVFEIRPATAGAAAALVHRISKAEVPFPNGADVAVPVRDNWSEATAKIQGEYCLILAASIFEKSKVEIPSNVHYSRAPENPEVDLVPIAAAPTPAAPSADVATISSTTGAAPAAAAAAATSVNQPPPPPPPAEGTNLSGQASHAPPHLLKKKNQDS